MTLTVVVLLFTGTVLWRSGGAEGNPVARALLTGGDSVMWLAKVALCGLVVAAVVSQRRVLVRALVIELAVLFGLAGAASNVWALRP